MVFWSSWLSQAPHTEDLPIGATRDRTPKSFGREHCLFRLSGRSVSGPPESLNSFGGEKLEFLLRLAIGHAKQVR